jgi:hypothetical protein
MTTGTSSVVQVRPNELVDILTADFQRRAEPQFAWKSAVSQFLALPGLRGFWPMSSVDGSGNLRDLSEQDRTLTNTNTAQYNYSNLIPYAQFTAASSQYFTRADEAGLDILGTESYIASAARGLTMGCWCWFDNAATALEFLLSKWGAVGQRSYLLRRSATGFGQFVITNDGSIQETVPASTTIDVATWVFMAGRFTPSAELKIWVNNNSWTNTSGISASIFNSNAAFTLGASSVPDSYLGGRLSMCFLCATALSDAIIGQLYEQSRVAYGVL